MSTQKRRSAADIIGKAAVQASVAALSLSATLVAQTTADPTKPAPSEEETIELSPFVVTNQGESGYLANNTLAGTRLRTSLNDIASPISVFTPELLKDVGATNLQEALLYSVNVENENEYAPDDGEGESIASTTQNRVRGLAAGMQTRGFFKTRFRPDTYNTDRLTVASGPNAILFGIGAPAGVIDATPTQAKLNKFSGSISNRVDNYGSFRTAVDLNVPIKKDVLGVRVAELKQKDKTFREPEFDDERRHFITGTFKPLATTTIRASYEHITDHRVHARDNLMEDNVSGWIALGKPLYNYRTGQWTFDGGATWQTRPDLQYWTDTGRIGSENRVFMGGGQLGGTAVQGLSWYNTGISFNRNRDYAKSFTDSAIIDPDVNYYGLGDKTDLSGDNRTFSIEQKVVKDLYVEISYNKESYHRLQDDPLRGGLSSIQADVNYYLPAAIDPATGYASTTAALVRNPNAGRYFIESEYLGYIQDTDTQTGRAMLSYSLNMAEHGLAWLGKHNFGAMWQRETTDNFKIKRRLMNSGSDFVVRPNDALNYAINNIKTRHYLNVPGLGGDSNGVDYPGSFVMPSWNAFIGGVQDDGKPQKSRTEVTGKMFVVQSAFLKDSLVATFGYRNDSQSVRSANFTSRNTTTHEWITEGVPLDATAVVQSGITRTYGLVYHTPLKWLTLLYNRSDAFNPQGDFRDWFNKPITPGSGIGKDYGVAIELTDKLFAKLTRYESTSINTIEYDWYYEEPKWSVIANMDASWGMVTNYARRLGNTADVNSVDEQRGFSWDGVRVTRDFKSEGYELELVYKPIKGLDVRATYSQATATNTKIAPGLQAYIAARLPIWEKYYGYPAWHQWDATMPAWDANWATNPDSTGYQLLNFGLPRIEEFKAAEGSVTQRGRKHRANLVADYKFEGTLKGTHAGGAVRWRSADTIGYYGKTNPLIASARQVADLSRPIRGDELIDFDLWVGYDRPLVIRGKTIDWSIQLNIRNAFTGGKLVPLAAYTDGTITTYSKKEPTAYYLTNTFAF